MSKYTPKYKINDLLRYQLGNSISILEVNSISAGDAGKLEYRFNIKKIISHIDGSVLIPRATWVLYCLDFDKEKVETILRLDYEAEEEIQRLLKISKDRVFKGSSRL